MLLEWLNKIGVDIGLLVAGAVGGIVSFSRRGEEGLSMWSRLTAFSSGVACAVYLTPIICNLFGVESENVARGVAYALGLGGMESVLKIELFFKKIDIATLVKAFVKISVKKEDQEDEKETKG